ncbi:MAG: hypothetical protein LRY73_13935 [Bacillus sp. (in: Bacteria)]|nr:hypothetical protein [Bacillus sp. (in: firmicutes)]
MLTHFLRAWAISRKYLKVLREKQRLRAYPLEEAAICLDAKCYKAMLAEEETEDPAGTRRLRRCPRKASS